jgi:hypothetical protein
MASPGISVGEIENILIIRYNFCNTGLLMRRMGFFLAFPRPNHLQIFIFKTILDWLTKSFANIHLLKKF